MAFTIREIKPEEAKPLAREAKACFSFFESIGIGRPERGVVAEEDGRLCGGAFLKTVDFAQNKRIGYIDAIFVCPAYRGTGVADALYKGAVEWLRANGCGHVTAMVIDENLKSKLRMEAAGLHESMFLDVSRYVGWSGCLKLCSRFFAAMLMGTNCKLYTDMPSSHWEEGPSLAVMAVFNIVALSLGGFLSRGMEGFETATQAGGILLVMSTLGSYLGSRLAGGRWRYTVPSGGAGLAFVLEALGSFYPWMGRMYPVKYEKTAACAKGLGICGMMEWAFVLATAVVCTVFRGLHPALAKAGAYGAAFLLYHCIPIFPFSTFGFKRVWEWSKPVCIALTAASLALFGYACMV